MLRALAIESSKLISPFLIPRTKKYLKIQFYLLVSKRKYKLIPIKLKLYQIKIG